MREILTVTAVQVPLASLRFRCERDSGVDDLDLLFANAALFFSRSFAERDLHADLSISLITCLLCTKMSIRFRNVQDILVHKRHVIKDIYSRRRGTTTVNDSIQHFLNPLIPVCHPSVTKDRSSDED